MRSERQQATGALDVFLHPGTSGGARKLRHMEFNLNQSYQTSTGYTERYFNNTPAWDHLLECYVWNHLNQGEAGEFNRADLWRAWHFQPKSTLSFCVLCELRKVFQLLFSLSLQQALPSVCNIQVCGVNVNVLKVKSFFFPVFYITVASWDTSSDALITNHHHQMNCWFPRAQGKC